MSIEDGCLGRQGDRGRTYDRFVQDLGEEHSRMDLDGSNNVVAEKFVVPTWTDSEIMRVSHRRAVFMLDPYCSPA